MTIRDASERDIEPIVQLLKLSLGDVSSTKSAAYWRWKHIDNPFGRSPVLVAEEAGAVVGVRAFMRWQFTHERKFLRALRAVDTATHPAYRGKNIFRELTMSLLDKCRADGDDFIFNTPNKFSMPGYLKMGWIELGKTRIWVRPRLLSLIASIFHESTQEQLRDFELSNHLDALNRLTTARTADSKALVPTLPPGYLEWRYLDCPVMKYYGWVDEQGQQGFVFTTRRRRWGLEMRVCELFAESDRPRHLAGIEGVAKAIRAQFVTAASIEGDQKSMRAAGFWNLGIGPILTYRQLNPQLPGEFLNLPFWRCPIGVMELF